MPQYFHMDVNIEADIVNVSDIQEKGRLVFLSQSIWQHSLYQALSPEVIFQRSR